MSNGAKRVFTPFTNELVDSLKIGDRISLSGNLYTARDAAHKRLIQLMEKREKLPFEIKGQVIYYVGPTPAPPGEIIGSAGPTTAYRMSKYAPSLIALGLKGMIGKGAVSPETQEAMKQHKAVYFLATGGAGALLREHITASEIVAYEDLGPEAIRKFTVKDFPVIVAQDCHGGDLFVEGRKRFSLLETG